MFLQKQLIKNIMMENNEKESKLMIQLGKQKKHHLRSSYNEEIVEDIYNTICKLDPKNLMLIEFLTLIIERDFIKNSNKLMQFVQLFDEFKAKSIDTPQPLKSEAQIEDHKFGKKTFIQMLKQMARRLYPGIKDAYEQIVYEKITKIQPDEHKIKVDDSLRRMLTKETIQSLNELDPLLQSVFEIYMPENYNLNLQFRWEEIKALEKKLPIVCLFRFLYEAEVIPQLIAPPMLLQLLCKIKMPVNPNAGSSKEAMFYTAQTMTNYLRDYATSPQIKLLEGDGGLTFLQFQIFLIRLAAEYCKDTKNEFASNIRKLEAYIKLKTAFDESTSRGNRFIEVAKRYMKKTGGRAEKIVVKKRQSRKKIEDLYDTKDQQLKEEASKNVYRNMGVEPRDLELIRKDLDAELPQVPPKKKIDKQNNGHFDIEKKHIVIGQQLPKIPEKNKPTPQKDPKKKKQDVLMGYKPQLPKPVEESNIGKLIHRPKKMRVNTQFPIILNEVFYPSDLKDQLFISPKAQVYLQTSYINLGERFYEDAFANYTKAKVNTQSKSPVTEFYYNIHAAQIFQSAGRDEVALAFYHKAKELLGVLNSIEGAARSHPYLGIGICLYHMDEFQYAFRCFQKARTVYGLNLEAESVDNAILQNNIGCCLMMLNRNQQAIKYFEVSHNILDLKAGCFDERTLVVQQNGNKNRKAYLQLLPQYRTMWKTYVQKSQTKLPAVKLAKGKK